VWLAARLCSAPLPSPLFTSLPFPYAGGGVLDQVAAAAAAPDPPYLLVVRCEAIWCLEFVVSGLDGDGQGADGGGGRGESEVIRPWGRVVADVWSCPVTPPAATHGCGGMGRRKRRRKDEAPLQREVRRAWR
jgi:hypothetical protein